MKNLFGVMFMVFILANSAQSSIEETTWKSLRSSKKLFIMQPNFARNFGPDGLFNLCATAEEFKSLHPIKQCMKYAVINQGQVNSATGEYSQMECSEWVTKMVRISRVNESEDELQRLPKTYQIEIVHSTGPRYMHHAFSKTYTIPDCY